MPLSAAQRKRCRSGRGRRIDLGLAIARCHAVPGRGMTLQQLAAFCGVSHQRISQIEQQALDKLRRVAVFDSTLSELITNHLDAARGREAAQPT